MLIRFEASLNGNAGQESPDILNTGHYGIIVRTRPLVSGETNLSEGRQDAVDAASNERCARKG